MPEPERNIEGNDRGNVGRNDPAPSAKASEDRSRGQDRGGDTSPPGGGILGVLLMPVTMVAAGIAALVSDLWHDRALWAFGRQGLDELGTALKPFPESIQVDESGTLWNPTQGEIARDSREHSGLHRRASLLPPPGWSAEQASQERGNVYGQGNGQDKGSEKDQGMSL
jgi:hypothetical protein